MIQANPVRNKTTAQQNQKYIQAEPSLVTRIKFRQEEFRKVVCWENFNITTAARNESFDRPDFLATATRSCHTC